VEKERPIPHNKFEILASRVMRYSVREEVKMRRQKKKEL